jgi:hypothetical protein
MKGHPVLTSSYSANHLSFLVNHIFLPPKLPQRSDGSTEENRILLDFVVDCARTYEEGVGHPQWAVVTKMLENLQWLKRNGSISGNNLKSRIREMKDQGLCILFGPIGLLVSVVADQWDTCRCYCATHYCPERRADDAP